MRHLARRDFAALERDGFVIRGGMRPETAKAWRHAIVGLGHGAGVRVDTGELAAGQAWASINRADPPRQLLREASKRWRRAQDRVARAGSQRRQRRPRGALVSAFGNTVSAARA